ncbi:MAG: sodium:solute symporter family transporter [Limisphaerales bacterium]
MQSLQLGILDLMLIVGYLLVVGLLGLYYSRGVRTGEDFFRAGRSLPWWAAGLSLVVSDIGAKDMIGLAGDGYRYGVVMMNFDFLGCIFPVLIAAFLFMPYLWLANVYTVPEYLGLRYDLRVRTCFSALWILFMVVTLATIFVSAAAMFEGILGWSFWFSVGITALTVGLYTTMGGLKAVVVTDAFSCVVLVIGAAIICWSGLSEIGGFRALGEAIESKSWTEHHLQLLPPADHPEYPWPAVLLGLGFVLGPAYWIGNQAIVQRTLGTRSPAEARASYILCAAIKLFFPLLLVLPGLMGIVLLESELGIPGKDWDGNQVLPLLLTRLLPTGILGIVIGAFLAGVLSNLDSYVNAASTMLVHDFYRPLIRPSASDPECLSLGRWLVPILLLLGVSMSYPIKQGFGSVFEAFQTFLSFIQGPLLALLLSGMLTNRANASGAMAGIALGVTSAALMTFSEALFGVSGGISFLWVAWWSFVASLTRVLMGSLLTPPREPHSLQGLVFEWKQSSGSQHG